MDKKDYERKRQKDKRKKRFQSTERAVSRKTFPKTARKRKDRVKEYWDDSVEDAPDEIQFRDS